MGDLECQKALVAKLLGYLLILGSLTVKAPQVCHSLLSPLSFRSESVRGILGAPPYRVSYRVSYRLFSLCAVIDHRRPIPGDPSCCPVNGLVLMVNTSTAAVVSAMMPVCSETWWLLSKPLRKIGPGTSRTGCRLKY